MRRPIVQKTSAYALLAVFIGGGVLAPFGHRVEHGWAWAEARKSGFYQVCDHSKHGDRFEATIRYVDVDPCPLCSWQPISLQTPDVTSATLHIFGSITLPLASHRVAFSARLYTIRGPPQAA